MRKPRGMRGFFLWENRAKIMTKGRKCKESGKIHTEKLRKNGGKNMGKHKVSLETLEKRHPCAEYSDFYHYVIDKINSGELVPIKKSGTNGKKPALPVSFWEYEKEKDYTEIFKELDFNYNPLIQTSFYKRRPEKYQEDRKNLILLSDYLTKKKHLLDISETRNERSFEIFHWEKFFEKGGGLTFCKQLGITEEMLNFHTATEPLAYYSFSKEAPQNILIVENEDTFYSIRRHINETEDNEILGTKFGTVIYGSGNRIQGPFKDYVNGAEKYFLADNTLLYFGDLDYTGICIYEWLHDKYPEKNIKVFKAAYEKMIDKAAEIGFKNLPPMKDGQNKNISDTFMTSFDIERQEQITEILRMGKFIPQEILNELDWRS